MKQVIAFLFVMLTCRIVSAQEIQAQADPVVEVGGRGTIKVQVTSESTASDPSLAMAPNLAIIGQPGMFQMDLRGMANKQILIATFTVVGKTPGLVVVTPSAVINGKRQMGKQIEVKVVPAGSGVKNKPQQPPAFQFPFGPGFDPFKDFFNNEPDEPTPKVQKTPTDPKLGLDYAPAPIAFLRATLDKTRAVVGEQVMLEIDLYVDADYPDPEMSDAHEASVSKFIRRSMIDETRSFDVLGYAKVANETYRVTRIRRAALFPIEAGDLEIGAMQVSMNIGRKPVPRTTDVLTVHVAEPPMEGRPPGYVVGTVGTYELKAEVTPREVKRGGVVSVRFELTGQGNVPSVLPVPVRADLEWLEPNVHDQIGRLDTERWGGMRTFNYVVRMKKEGDVDLGRIVLPFWNPVKLAYETAGVELGSIHVLPGALEDDNPQSKLPELPAPRASLAGSRVHRHLDDSPFFWGALLAPALVFASAAGARTALRKTKEAMEKRNRSPMRELARRTDAARAACDEKDARAADAAIVRLLEQAALAKHDVNVRGGTKSEAQRALEDAGVKEDVAKELIAILRACEDARFSPDDAGIDHARERFERACKVVEDL